MWLEKLLLLVSFMEQSPGHFKLDVTATGKPPKKQVQTLALLWINIVKEECNKFDTF